MIAYILVFALGLLAGYILFHPKDDSNFQEYTKIWIQDGTNHVIVLRSLTRDKILAIAYRITAGRPFRYRSLVGKGKLLTRSQWDHFTAECVDRGILERGKNRILTPSPTGFKFFTELTTSSHTHTAELR